MNIIQELYDLADEIDESLYDIGKDKAKDKAKEDKFVFVVPNWMKERCEKLYDIQFVDWIAETPNVKYILDKPLSIA